MTRARSKRTWNISLGKMRSQAQKITQRNGKFEVHTPAGVAGVVGTDFYTAYENNVMTATNLEGPSGVQQVHHIGKGAAIAF